MLKKGILIIFRANVISLIFNLIANFLLPKYLSVNAYADIKAFQLYITYIGLLHFGYADGMYLNYGGKNKQMIDKNALAIDIKTMRIFQFDMTLIGIFASLFLHNYIWLAFSLSVLPLNMTSYYKLLYQATGEFTKYGSIMNITSIITFVVNMGLLFGAKFTSSGKPYIIVYVILYVVLWLYMEYIIFHSYELKGTKGGFSFQQLYHNVKDGLLLMLGNLSNTFFTGMDRWFVKFLMNTVSFAQYSFAVSVENFLNVAVTPISVTLYNYFCIHSERKEIKRMQSYIVLFSVLLPACAFPAKLILETILKKYMASAVVINLLFAAQTYSAINKCIYVNLYKANRQQRKYFVKLIYALAFGFASNILFWNIRKNMVSFAAATLLSNIFWLILSIADFKETAPSLKEFTFIGIETAAFLFLGNYCNSMIGLLGYLSITVCAAFLLMKECVISAIKELIPYKKSNISK